MGVFSLGKIVNVIFVILLSTLLFAVLQPGAFMTVPGNTKKISFFKRETNFWASIVHTGMFFVGMSGIMVIYQILLSPVMTLIFGE